MFEVLLAVMVISGITIAYCVGFLQGVDNEGKRLSARVIRPANITIEKHYKVVEYNITDGKALDIDFPNTRGAV